jgi:hypothetical protein
MQEGLEQNFLSHGAVDEVSVYDGVLAASGAAYSIIETIIALTGHIRAIRIGKSQY